MKEKVGMNKTAVNDSVRILGTVTITPANNQIMIEHQIAVRLLITLPNR